LADSGQSPSGSVRADGYVQWQGQRVARVLQLVRVPVLAFRVSAARGGEDGANGDRLSADAERREFQYGGRESTDREGHRRTTRPVNI